MNKLYGIDYNFYATGGIGNQKLMKMGCKTIFFYTESEMLKVFAELKEDYAVGEIKPFITDINRIEYNIS
ncbi:hypothetical protein [Bacillus xiapuensis]|uniref:Uncharacterized protein n=1 Tax=Bacillus xiapuensis TaxID=2014075 RepID=A0ABU6NA35_9BACI|nr:hypothetical protein [Bacillus xiapuensis]